MIDDRGVTPEAKAALLAGCAKIEAERKEPLVATIWHVPVRRSLADEEEWLDVASIGLTVEIAMSLAAKTDEVLKVFASRNPIQRIAKVRIEEVME